MAIHIPKTDINGKTKMYNKKYTMEKLNQTSLPPVRNNILDP